MDINFLHEEELKIPIEYDDNIGFLCEMENIISRYIEVLKRYEFDNDSITKVNSFKMYCMEGLKCYYRGQHAKGYQKFKTALKHLTIKEGLVTKTLDEIEFFRARIHKNLEDDYSEREMNYIPFSKRGIVKSERYSFPGLPCLYLGASVYACWYELGKPNLDEIQVARISLKKGAKINVLDLTNIPSVVYKKKLSDDELREYVLFWPILAMCSVKVNNHNSNFKPEYIFPQFLMEYISSGEIQNENVIGIKYPSVKVMSHHFDENAWKLYTNYVFPTTMDIDKDVDDDVLDKVFTVEKTFSGKTIDILSSKDTPFFYNEMAKERENEYIFFGDDICKSYDCTPFFDMELFISDWDKYIKSKK